MTLLDGVRARLAVCNPFLVDFGTTVSLGASLRPWGVRTVFPPSFFCRDALLGVILKNGVQNSLPERWETRAPWAQQPGWAFQLWVGSIYLSTVSMV